MKVETPIINVNTTTNPEQFARNNSGFLKHFFGTTDLLPLWIADMDFEISHSISDAIRDRLKSGLFGYEVRQPNVAESIVKWFQKRHNLILNPTQFLFMNNILGSMAMVIDEYTVEGDGVIIQPPVYHQFAEIIRRLNRKVVDNPLLLEAGRYEINFNHLRELAANPKNKLIILCNPHNPSGRAWPINDVKKIAKIVAENNLLILSDEIHADVIYDGFQFNSIMSPQKAMHKNSIMFGSPAKTFGMPSITDAFIYTDDKQVYKRLKNRIYKFRLESDNALTFVSTFAAYMYGEKWLENKINYFQKVIKWVNTFLATELQEISLIQPEATYQLWLDFRDLSMSDDEINTLLTKKAGLALTPGKWFGKEGIGFVRVNIATPFGNIQNAFNQLKTAIEGR